MNAHKKVLTVKVGEEMSDRGHKAVLTDILNAANPLISLKVLMDIGLMREILPEVADLVGAEQDPVHHPEGDVWTHTKMVIRNLVNDCSPLKKPSAELMLAALLHDIGKPSTTVHHGHGHISTHGHAEVGAEMAEKICRRLKISRQQTAQVADLVRLHMLMHQVDELRQPKLVALLRRDDINALIALQHADARATTRSDRDRKSRRQFLLNKLQELNSR